MADAAAGTIVAVHALTLTGTDLPRVGIILATAVTVASLGFATAYGRGTLLSRVAHGSTAGEIVLSRLLIAAAMIVWVGVPVAGRFVSARGLLTASGLLLLAVGGALIVHEPDYSPRTRRVRLAAVFGCVAGLISFAFYSGRIEPSSRRLPTRGAASMSFNPPPALHAAPKIADP